MTASTKGHIHFGQLISPLHHIGAWPLVITDLSGLRQSTYIIIASLPAAGAWMDVLSQHSP